MEMMCFDEMYSFSRWTSSSSNGSESYTKPSALLNSRCPIGGSGCSSSSSIGRRPWSRCLGFIAMEDKTVCVIKNST